MFTGIEREQLVRYSFLLSLPAILGAATIDVLLAQDLRRAEDIHFIGIESYAIGAAISAIVGYASIPHPGRAGNQWKILYLHSIALLLV
jgi:undecaprenyl-diphosphatase